jgi:hypothetical protein
VEEVKTPKRPKRPKGPKDQKIYKSYYLLELTYYSSLINFCRKGQKAKSQKAQRIALNAAKVSLNYFIFQPNQLLLKLPKKPKRPTKADKGCLSLPIGHPK